MQTHICNGHYMFGNTFVQPDMPGYNNCWNHRLAPADRQLPPYPDLPNCTASGHNGPITDCCYYCKDSNMSSTKTEIPYADPNEVKCLCDSCIYCGICNSDIVRDPLTKNIVNISTELKKTLMVTLYGTKPELDKTIEMETGKRYAVTYATEHGLEMSIGYLEVIGSSIPDKCIYYMNDTLNKSITSTGYIGIDCSTEGHADKRKIYISTIRNVEFLNDGETPSEPLPPEPKTVIMKMNDFLDAVERGDIIITKKSTEETVVIE